MLSQHYWASFCMCREHFWEGRERPTGVFHVSSGPGGPCKTYKIHRLVLQQTRERKEPHMYSSSSLGLAESNWAARVSVDPIKREFPQRGPQINGVISSITFFFFSLFLFLFFGGWSSCSFSFDATEMEGDQSPTWEMETSQQGRLFIFQLSTNRKNKKKIQCKPKKGSHTQTQHYHIY